MSVDLCAQKDPRGRSVLQERERDKVGRERVSGERSQRNKDQRLTACCERPSWQATTIPVGLCVKRTADSVLLTCWTRQSGDRTSQHSGH